MECELFKVLLKHVSGHLVVLFQFAWLYLQKVCTVINKITNKITRSFNMVLLGPINNSNQHITKNTNISVTLSSKIATGKCNQNISIFL